MCKEALCEDIHIMCWRCLYGGACVQMHCVRMYRWRCRCGGDAGGRLASFKGDLELCLHSVVAAVDQHAVAGVRVELGVQLQLRCVVLHVALQTTPGRPSTPHDGLHSYTVTAVIIIIKKISRVPIYHTRWQHRALYNNTIHTHTHTTQQHVKDPGYSATYT